MTGLWRQPAGGWLSFGRSTPAAFMRSHACRLNGKLTADAFNPDGKYLQVLSGGKCKDDQHDLTVDCRRRFLETWESMGYGRAVTASHSDTIESIGFQPGNQFITTMTNIYEGDNARIWRVSDGVEMKNLNVRFDHPLLSILPPRNTSASSDSRYVLTGSAGAWDVWDTLSRTKIQVTTAGVEEDKLEASDALSRCQPVGVQREKER